MLKFIVCSFLSVFIFVACRPEIKNDSGDLVHSRLLYDTASTAIIAWDRTFPYPFDSINYRATFLTQQDINLIDSLIVASVANYNDSQDDKINYSRIDMKSINYRRQLIAVLNQAGEKEVWINCFCALWDKFWKEEVVMVYDGGACFFNFKVNLRTKTVFSFRVNGSA